MASFTASAAEHVAGIGCSHVQQLDKEHSLKSIIVAMNTVARAEREDDVLQVPVLWR